MPNHIINFYTKIGIEKGLIGGTLIAVAEISGCTDTVESTLTVLSTPTALCIDSDVIQGCGPLNVEFSTCSSLASDVSYEWNFGRRTNDTAPATASPTTISFTNLGAEPITYEATLSSSNSCGSENASINITVLPQPFAEIGIDSSLTGCSPYTVLLSNRSSASVTNCSWLGSDGFMLNDCRDTFSLTLTADTAATQYILSLEAENSCGTDIVSDTITIIPPGVTPLFSLDDLDFTVCPGDTLFFADESSPRPTEIFWTFGDGGTSTQDSVFYVFRQADTSFEVTLRASTGCGYAELSRQVTVNPRPQGDLTHPLAICAGMEVDVNISSNASAFLVDYGNNYIGSSANEIVNYDSSGRYEIIARLVSSEGCRDSIFSIIEVYPQPEATVEIGDTVCLGQRVNLTSIGAGAFTNVWFFENGETATGPTVLWTPTEVGLSGGSLRVTSSFGCIDSSSFIIPVRPTPIAQFDLTVLELCSPGIVNISDLSSGTGTRTYEYVFGDGSTQTWSSGEHSYFEGGFYTITQIVSLDGICSDTTFSDVFIANTPQLEVDLIDERCELTDLAFLDIYGIESTTDIRVQGTGYDSMNISRANLISPGSYIISAISSDGCTAADTIEIEPLQEILLSIMPDTTIKFGESIELASTVNRSGLTYSWSPDTFLNSAFVVRPTSTPFSEQTYTLSVTDGSCSKSAEVTISVEREDPVLTSTAFSPNGDGVNDEWSIIFNSSVSDFVKFQIFDRWGNSVYNDIKAPSAFGVRQSTWNGNVFNQGKPAQTGVYVYLISGTLIDGSPFLLKGDITLIR